MPHPRPAPRAALLAALLLTCAVLSHAARRDRTPDLVWTRPDFASLGVESIAMLPVATYNHDVAAERTVAQALGAAVRPTGYRWVSATTARDLMDVDHAGRQLLERTRDGVLEDVRVDSLLAPLLCARLRTDALLSVRVDLWEQRTLEWNQPGKPATTVAVHAALVDSLGRLLWTASGSQTQEGAEQVVDTRQPDLAGGGVRGAGAGVPQPPSWDEVLNRLFARWAPQFPPMPAAPAGSRQEP